MAGRCGQARKRCGHCGAKIQTGKMTGCDVRGKSNLRLFGFSSTEIESPSILVTGRGCPPLPFTGLRSRG